jgi:hypothetical protein
MWQTLNLNLPYEKGQQVYKDSLTEFIRSHDGRRITALDVLHLPKCALSWTGKQPGNFRSVQQITLSWLRNSSSHLAPWGCRVGIYLSLFCVLLNRMPDDMDCSGLFECFSDLFTVLGRCCQDTGDLVTDIGSFYDALEHVENNLSAASPRLKHEAASLGQPPALAEEQKK